MSSQLINHLVHNGCKLLYIQESGKLDVLDCMTAGVLLLLLAKRYIRSARSELEGAQRPQSSTTMLNSAQSPRIWKVPVTRFVCRRHSLWELFCLPLPRFTIVFALSCWLKKKPCSETDDGESRFFQTKFVFFLGIYSTIEPSSVAWITVPTMFQENAKMQGCDHFCLHINSLSKRL